jgi:streptogramin lyase
VNLLNDHSSRVPFELGKRERRQIMKVIATIVLALGLTVIASAQEKRDCVPGKPEPVFSVPKGQDTETVAVAHNGDVFTVEMYSGTVYRIDTDGKAKVIATLFPAGKYPSLVALGLMLGDDGSIFVLANTWDPATHGVWQVYLDGRVQLVADIPIQGVLNGQPTYGLLNAQAFDRQGNRYVTDSTLGAIWKVSREGTVQLWVQSDLLIWATDPTGPFGAAGIAYRDGTLYVVNVDTGAGTLPYLRGSNYPVVSIPIERDGTAGPVQVSVVGDIRAPDGIAFDHQGDMYVVDFGGEPAWGPSFLPYAGPARLLRFDRDGTNETVIAEAGLCNSSKVALRGNTAYVTNLYVAGGGLYGFAGCLPEVVPNIVKVDLCVNH